MEFWGDKLTDHAHYSEAFSGVDLIFCASSGYHEYFKAAKIKSEVLGWSFAPDYVEHKNLNQVRSTIHSFVFPGSTSYGQDLHRGRYNDLVEVMEQSNLQLWTDEPDLKKGKDSKSSLKRIKPRWVVGKAGSLLLRTLPVVILEKPRRQEWVNWDLAKIIESEITRQKGIVQRGMYFINKKKIGQLYPKHCHPAIYGQNYYDLIRNSQDVLNRYRDEDADGPNIRVFEVTGMGACLLTDKEDKVSEFFVPDKEVVTYSSVGEAIGKAAYLLAHDDEREKIAFAGQKRTLAEYTTYHRCERIH